MSFWPSVSGMMPATLQGMLGYGARPTITVDESDPVSVLRNIGMPSRFNSINQNLLVLALTNPPNRISERVAKALNEQYPPFGMNYDSDILVFYGDALLNIAFMSKLRDILKLAVPARDRDAIRSGLSGDSNRYLVLGDKIPNCIQLRPLGQPYNVTVGSFSTPGTLPGALVSPTDAPLAPTDAPAMPGAFPALAPPSTALDASFVNRSASDFSCDRTLSAILGAIYIQYGDSAIPDIADWITKSFPIDALIEKMRYNRDQGTPYVRPEAGIGLRVGGAAAVTAGAVAAAAGIANTPPNRSPLPYPTNFKPDTVSEQNYVLNPPPDAYTLPTPALFYRPAAEGDGFAARYMVEKYTPLRLSFMNLGGEVLAIIVDSNGNDIMATETSARFMPYIIDPSNARDVFAFLQDNQVIAPLPGAATRR